jgi:uncharacterized protein YjbJ (UPF0337 family)
LFEAGIAPILGLAQAKQTRIVERIAFLADHLLYGSIWRPAPGPTTTDQAGRRSDERARRCAWASSPNSVPAWVPTGPDLDLHWWPAGAGMAGFGVSHPGNPRRGPPANPEDGIMGADDKARNKAEELKGQGKEALGRATGDEELEAEGRTDQANSDLKQAGEKVKDAFKR